MLSVGDQEVRKEPFEMNELCSYLFDQWIGVWNCSIKLGLLESATSLPQGAILNVAGGKSELKGGSKRGEN
jgi:hypothetical protein